MLRRLLSLVLSGLFMVNQIGFAMPEAGEGPGIGIVGVGIDSSGNVSIFSDGDINFAEKAMIFESYNLPKDNVGVNLYPFASDGDILDLSLWNTYLGKELLTADVNLKKAAMHIISSDPALMDIVNELEGNSELKFRCWIEPGKYMRVSIADDGVVLNTLDLNVRVDAHFGSDNSVLKEIFETRLAKLLEDDVASNSKFLALRRAVSAYFLGQGLKRLVEKNNGLSFLSGRNILIKGKKSGFWKKEFLEKYMELYFNSSESMFSGGVNLYTFPACFHELTVKVWNLLKRCAVKAKGKFIRSREVDSPMFVFEKLDNVMRFFVGVGRQIRRFRMNMISAFLDSKIYEGTSVGKDQIVNAVSKINMKDGQVSYSSIKDAFFYLINALEEKGFLREEIGNSFSDAILEMPDKDLSDGIYNVAYRFLSFVKRYNVLFTESKGQVNYVNEIFNKQLAKAVLCQNDLCLWNYSFEMSKAPINVRNWIEEEFGIDRIRNMFLSGNILENDIWALFEIAKAEGQTADMVRRLLIEDNFYTRKRVKGLVSVFADLLKNGELRNFISHNFGQDDLFKLAVYINNLSNSSRKDAMTYAELNTFKLYRDMPDTIKKAIDQVIEHIFIVRDEAFVRETKAKIETEGLVNAGELLEKGINFHDINISPEELWDLLMLLDRHIANNIIDSKHRHLVEVIKIMAMFLNKEFDKMTDNKDLKESIKELYEKFKKLRGEDKKAVIIGTILHDIGSMKGLRDFRHNEIGVKIMNIFVSDRGYNDTLLAKIKSIILNHGMFGDFGVIYIPADFKSIDKEESLIILLSAFFDSLRIGEANRLDVTKMKRMLSLQSKEDKLLNDKISFLKYRLGGLLNPAAFVEERDRWNIADKVIAELKNRDIYGNQFIEIWSKVSVFSPVLFYSIGKRDISNFVSLLGNITKIVSLHSECSNVIEINVDTDIDVMGMFSLDKEKFYEIVNKIFLALKDGKDIPISVKGSDKGKKLSLTINILELIDDEEKEEIAEKFLTGEGVNLDDIAFILGRSMSINEVFPYVLKKLGVEEGLVYDLVRHADGVMGADIVRVKQMVDMAKKRNLKDLLRCYNLDKRLVGAIISQDVEAKNKWFLDVMLSLGLSDVPIADRDKDSYKNAWDFLTTWAKDISNLSVDIAEKLGKENKFSIAAAGIYKAVLIGVISGRIKLDKYLDEATDKFSVESTQRGGIELVFVNQL